MEETGGNILGLSNKILLWIIIKHNCIIICKQYSVSAAKKSINEYDKGYNGRNCEGDSVIPNELFDGQYIEGGGVQGFKGFSGYTLIIGINHDESG